MRISSRLCLAIGLSLCIATTASIVLFGHLGTVRTAFADGFFGPFLPLQVSTVPSNGDTTPYGLAFVPNGFPEREDISTGTLLVSNFNSSATPGAGLGTTIITVNPKTGQTGQFFPRAGAPTPPPIGFTNALTIARVGLVFAGSLPTSDGTFATAMPGPLDVFDGNGNLLKQLSSNELVDGPWGMALNDRGNTAQLFVSNIFDTSGHFKGSITRLDVLMSSSGITVLDKITIADSYTSAPDTAGTVVGPAGLAYDSFNDILYVAAEGDNAIYAVKGAGHFTSEHHGKGQVIYDDQNVLHGPLGLIFAPNGNLITANADPAHFPPMTDTSEIVEITRSGTFVRKFSIDPNSGSAFAVLINNKGPVSQFVYVDDFVSNCTIWNLFHAFGEGDDNSQH